jgi:replication-associated recombination protein RarA
VPASKQELFTPDGTELGVAVSAMTKCLRRERELEAMYFARQIEQGGFWRYAWRRLAIFAAEDVGIANPAAVVVVDACKSAYEATRKESKGEPDGALLGLAILVCARSPKNREASELSEVVGHLVSDEGWSAEVPDEAYDLHTSKGRQSMSTTERLTHSFEVASQGSPKSGPRDWLLWVRRWGARKGALDRTQVEDEATEWNREGLLRFGDGYRS